MKQRKRLVAFFLLATLVTGCFAVPGLGEEANAKAPITTEPITLSILTQRDPTVMVDNTKDLYIFKWLEYWMNEQGYNIALDVQSAEDPQQQLALMLGTGELPDIVWYCQLANNDAVTYGAGEGMILEWTPYISNPELMPNVYALTQSYPLAFTESTCVDGGIYALPYMDDRCYLWAAGNLPSSCNLIFNRNWLEECGIAVPDTMEGVLDTLRAFKGVTPANGGTAIPYLGLNGNLEIYLWAALGYYGSGIQQFGTEISIKDGAIALPAASEDYRTYVELMHTMYSEGLIPTDYYTMDADTAKALAQSGVCGAFGDSGLMAIAPTTFNEWETALPVTAGDNDQVVSSTASPVNQGRLWASADTKYPEVVAYMVDYIFGFDGYQMMKYGPMKGEDILGLVEGWYVENGVWMNDSVKNGTFGNVDMYGLTYMYPHGKIGCSIGAVADIRNPDGSGVPWEYKYYTDAVTGEEVKLVIKTLYTEENADGYARIKKAAAWTDTGHVTTVRLPGAYVAQDKIVRADELKKLLQDYITAETVKFVTGLRPLSELDMYFEGLKKMGVDEYIQIYRDSYSGYIESIFG